MQLADAGRSGVLDVEVDSVEPDPIARRREADANRDVAAERRLIRIDVEPQVVRERHDAIGQATGDRAPMRRARRSREPRATDAAARSAPSTRRERRPRDRSAKRKRSAWHLRRHDREQAIGVDLIADRDVELAHRARLARPHGVLHLHRLEHDERSAGGDRLPRPRPSTLTTLPGIGAVNAPLTAATFASGNRGRSTSASCAPSSSTHVRSRIATDARMPAMTAVLDEPQPIASTPKLETCVVLPPIARSIPPRRCARPIAELDRVAADVVRDPLVREPDVAPARPAPTRADRGGARCRRASRRSRRCAGDRDPAASPRARRRGCRGSACRARRRGMPGARGCARAARDSSRPRAARSARVRAAVAAPPRRASAPTRSACRSSSRSGCRPRCRPRRRARRGSRSEHRRRARARSSADSRDRRPRRTAGPRSPSRAAAGSSGTRSPRAIRICSRTRSRPVTSSVTGCSTCSRVLTSRK